MHIKYSIYYILNKRLYNCALFFFHSLLSIHIFSPHHCESLSLSYPLIFYFNGKLFFFFDEKSFCGFQMICLNSNSQHWQTFALYWISKMLYLRVYKFGWVPTLFWLPTYSWHLEDCLKLWPDNNIICEWTTGFIPSWLFCVQRHG